MSRERYITDSSRLIYETKAGVVYINEKDLIILSFKGKQSKPSLYMKLRTIEALKAKAIELVTQYNQTLDRKAKEQEKNKLRKQEFASSLSVGDYLVSSWGYSMTIVDYYRVVSIKGLNLQIESVGNNIVEGSGGYQGSCVPNTKSKGGEVLKATVTPYGVKVKSNYASKWDGVSSHYFNYMD